MSNTSPAHTIETVIRVLLIDQQRQQVVLCKEPGDPHWFLPCGELPDEKTPRDFLTSLVHRHLPRTARVALQDQLEEALPVAWLYPPASVLPYSTRILQVVFLLTLDPGTIPASEDAWARFWPEAVFCLEPPVIQTVVVAESHNWLPLIDLRPTRAVIDDIADIRFARYEPVRVMGGDPEAESVEDYVGYGGKVIGVTNTLPRWFCVQLADGRKIAALPHHIQPEAGPEPVQAHRRPRPAARQVWPGQPLLDMEEAEANLQTLTRSLQVQTSSSRAACRKALHHTAPTETIIALIRAIDESATNQTIVQQFREAAEKEDGHDQR
ncbi:MAG: hypothetical protein ACRDIV_17695 [Ktedonobacteraceae bacterium]